MSHYVECRPGFKDREALVAALCAAGFQRAQIEIHDQSVPLFGYRGDLREQQAHVVIRREHVGPGANDVGWECLADGSYRAWISEFDARHRFDTVLQNRIKQEYAYQVVDRQQRALGRSVQRRALPNGELEVVIAGYR